MKRFNKYKDFYLANGIKKAFAGIIDYLLVIVSSILCIGLIAFPILENNETFTSNRDNLYYRAEQLYLIQAETRLVKLDPKQDNKALIPQNEVFKDYFYQQMALSYSKEPSLYDQNNIVLDSKYEPATFENDLLGYYYAHYKQVRGIKTEDYGSLAPHMYFIKLIEESSAKEYYVFNNEDLPYLKADAGVKIYNFINEKSSDSLVFNTVYETYFELVKKGLEELQSYDLYLNHFASYKDSMMRLYEIEFISLLIVFTIIYVIAIILPQYIFGNGITLGRFIMKLRTYHNKEKFIYAIFRQLLELLTALTMLLIIGFFTYGAFLFSLPVVGPITILTILSFITTYAIINFACSLFTKNKLYLSELLTKSITLNLKEPKVNEELIITQSDIKEEINE